MLESGFATAEDIDRGLVLGAAHPQGPLALADLIGMDTTKAIAESLYEEFKEPLYAAPPLLNRMVDAGLLGRKTGRGFYTYNLRGPRLAPYARSSMPDLISYAVADGVANLHLNPPPT